MGRGTPGGAGPGPGSTEVLLSSMGWRGSRPALTAPARCGRTEATPPPSAPKPGGSRRCPCGAAREDAAVRSALSGRTRRVGRVRWDSCDHSSRHRAALGSVGDQQKVLFFPFRACERFGKCCRVTLGKRQRVQHDVPQSCSGSGARSTGSPTTISHTMSAQLLQQRTARDPHVCRGPFEGSSATTEPLISGSGLLGMGVCN